MTTSWVTTAEAGVVGKPGRVKALQYYTARMSRLAAETRGDVPPLVKSDVVTT